MATKKAKAAAKAGAAAKAAAPAAGADAEQEQEAQATQGEPATDNMANPYPTDGSVPYAYGAGDVVHVVRADGTTHEGTVVEVVPGHVVRLKDGRDTEEFVRAEALKLAPRKG
jgi:hypothetical protein